MSTTTDTTADTSEKTPTKVITRTVTKVAALFIVACSLFVGIGGTPAEAGTVGRSGATGDYSVAPIQCRHRIQGATQTLSIWAPAPRVVGANRYAGAGNDAQWVRYSAYLVDYRTGNLVDWAPGQWARANDNYVTTWNDGGLWTVGALSSRIYRVYYVIEWHDGYRTIGTLAHEADNVHYTDAYGVKHTGLTACWRYR